MRRRRRRSLALGLLAGGRRRRRPAPTPPTIGGCPVFPASSVWNQRGRQAAGREGLGDADPLDRPRLARARRLRLGPLRRPADRHPVRRRLGQHDAEGEAAASTTPTSPTRARTRSRRTSPIEGDPNPGDGDRHALIVDRDTCTLYELYALQRTGSGWAAGSGAIWSLALEQAPAGRLDVGRRGRPADPPRPRALRRGRRRRDRPRAPLHRARDAARLHLPGAPLRERLDRSRRCRRWACASG